MKSVTVFAYGQTGSGKTHTITGEYKNLGILQSYIKDIFKYIETNKKNVKYQIVSTFFEIYNEKIYDLYTNNDQYDESYKHIEIKESSNFETIIDGLNEVKIYN